MAEEPKNEKREFLQGVGDTIVTTIPQGWKYVMYLYTADEENNSYGTYICTNLSSDELSNYFNTHLTPEDNSEVLEYLSIWDDINYEIDEKILSRITEFLCGFGPKLCCHVNVLDPDVPGTSKKWMNIDQKYEKEFLSHFAPTETTQASCRDRDEIVKSQIGVE